MAERSPNFEQQRIELAVEAAFAANEAYDAAEAAGNKWWNLHTALSQASTGAMVVSYEEVEAAGDECDEVAESIFLFNRAAGSLIGRETSGSDSLFSGSADYSTRQIGSAEYQQSFEEKISFFLDPNKKLSLDEQLVTLGKFWRKLGYKELPVLTNQQTAQLTKAVEAHPERRVVAAPLMSLVQRKAIAILARANFESQQFDTAVTDPIWAPERGRLLYGKLLQAPMDIVETSYQKYALGYKSINGEIVNRDKFIWALEMNDQIAIDAYDNEWIFPIMDVGVHAPRTKAEAARLYAQIDPIVTPEALIAMKLLHQANGTPNAGGEIEVANEAVYKLGENCEFKELISVVSVRWDLNDRQVCLDFRASDFAFNNFSVRGADSGLKP